MEEKGFKYVTRSAKHCVHPEPSETATPPPPPRAKEEKNLPTRRIFRPEPDPLTRRARATWPCPASPPATRGRRGPGREGRRHRRRRPDCAGAGARLLSLGVQAAVMAAALALFLLFAAAAAILLLHLVVAARAFRNQRHGGAGRSRYRVPETSYTPSRAGLSPADLRFLPCFAASASASASPELCAVCLEAACAGERWRALPACGHAFHAACVDRWLARAAACPVCRAAVSASAS